MTTYNKKQMEKILRDAGIDLLALGFPDLTFNPEYSPYENYTFDNLKLGQVETEEGILPIITGGYGYKGKYEDKTEKRYIFTLIGNKLREIREIKCW